MTTEDEAELEPTAASPNNAHAMSDNKIEDEDDDASINIDSLPESPTVTMERKRIQDEQQQQQHDDAGQQQQHAGNVRRDSLQYSFAANEMQPHPYSNMSASMMSAGGGSAGSWYFQPVPHGQGIANNSAYGPDFYGGSYHSQSQGGVGNAQQPHQPIPPHLSCWMHGGQVSDVSAYGSSGGYGSSLGQNQMGQIATDAAAATMGTIREGGDSSSPGSRYANMQGRYGGPPPDLTHLLPDEDVYKVYSSRWIMLGYMSLLNLLSDWTCYSVAPIALLTKKAFGDVDPESLVTVFLGANAVASAMEPAILGRLGLRKTVLFGGFLLMLGSIVKSGGLRSLMMMKNEGGMTREEMLEEESEDITWRLFLGFFLVGLSQPLYQCTPALLSASWFPENERTMATGVALNSNQLGIGCAFVFGTMLVATEDDIIPYFGLLSVIATITFVGTALQFEDAPPTPPSDTARVIKGDLEIKIPRIPFLGIGMDRRSSAANLKGVASSNSIPARKAEAAPAPASTGEAVEVTLAGIRDVEKEMRYGAAVGAPSPASTDEPVNMEGAAKRGDDEGETAGAAPIHAQPNHPLAGGVPPGAPPGSYPFMMAPPPPGYYPSYPPYPSGAPGMGYPPMDDGGGRRSNLTPTFYHGYDQQGHYHNALLETSGYDDGYAPFAGDDEGVEPIMTQLDHQLDVDVRDDQIVQQFKACFRRPGFSHCVVAFTTSGIIVNTLSTFMDYLVTLNGAGREYVGIVGGTFQIFIMCSSLVFGGWTDHSRKYYFVILAMLIFGAFALAVCNVNLDSDAGGDLRLNLLFVAVLAGPLQPISTELGVEVVYPLSENTVLVIQQLFSNLLSAAFIPVFKAMRDIGTAKDESEIKSMYEVPQYTFSFYMLIIIHAVSTCYFATFNGKYLRYEAEEEKKAKKEEERERLLADLHEKHNKGELDAGYGSVEPN